MGLSAPLNLPFIEAHRKVSATTKDNAHGIVAFFQHVGHIIGIKIYTLEIIGQCGLEKFLRSHFLAVDKGGVLSQSADVEPGFDHLFTKGKVFTVIARRNAGFLNQAVIIKRASQPHRTPVLFIQKTDFKGLNITFQRNSFPFITISQCGLNFPKSNITTMQWFSLILDIQHFGR